MKQNATLPTYRDLDQSEKDWLEQLDDKGEERGYFEPLGPGHSAILTDEGPVLIVTFESMKTVRSLRANQEPLGFELVAENGYSNLCILAHDDSWFRDPRVYGFFDRLVDDGFFEDFDQVVFYGSGMGGYAATAFSVAAPGATVVAVQPQATLDPQITGWDHRFIGKRRLPFNDRYGFAPDMMDAADHGFVIFDPHEEQDAMHAALFTRDHIDLLPVRNYGKRIEAGFISMGILTPIIEAACKGKLDRAAFYDLYRARRDQGIYLRNLLQRLTDEDRLKATVWLCNNVLGRINAPKFRRRLAEVEAILATQAEAAADVDPKAPELVPDPDMASDIDDSKSA